MSDARKTFQLRYVGTRFTGARLPLEVLSDLPAFRDLLVSYAKDRWRASHADRQRLPKGFDKSISLDLIALEDGSAKPKLEWSREIAQAVLPGFSDELEDIVSRSYDDLVKLVDGAGRREYPQALSSEHIRALNKLGSGLRDNEKIEFLDSLGDDGNVVYLDTYRRKALITHVRDTYQLRFEGIGRLVGQHENGSIVVETEEYGELRIVVDADRVTQEFDRNIGSSIQFALQIELDNNDNYRSIIETYDVELIDAELSDHIFRCRGRLADIRQLSSGWLDGDGISPDPRALNAAEQFLSRRPSFAVAFKIFPTPGGGVLFEFEVDGWDYSVEFTSNGSVEIYGVQIDGPDELDLQTFDGPNDDFIEFFDNQVRR